MNILKTHQQWTYFEMFFCTFQKKGDILDNFNKDNEISFEISNYNFLWKLKQICIHEKESSSKNLRILKYLEHDFRFCISNSNMHALTYVFWGHFKMQNSPDHSWLDYG